MKKIIIFLVSGMLLMSSGARAEEIYLNCKFVRGDFTSLEPYFSSENMNKNSEFANDIGISLDLKNKKILYLTDALFNNSTEYLQSTIRIIDWYEKNITFIYSLSDNMIYIYNLDRLSGNLKRTIDMIDPITKSKQKIKVSSYSECSKQNKKI